MTIRKILLALSGSASAEASVVTALAAASRFHARLEAVHVRVDSRDVAPLAGEGLSGAMIEDLMSATDTEGVERSAAVRAMFDRLVARHGIEVAPAGRSGTEASASFRELVGREDDLVARLARLADLTIVPHPAAADEVSSSDALHAVLFDSGRPVMIAPRAVPARLGARVCVAWNGTAEASAAVFGVLPWLREAEAVRILHAPEYQRRGPPAADLVGYLAIHGVQADVALFRPIDREVGAGLLAGASEFGADMMCMGAYSHSRLRQLILGGVTRHVLEHATLAVLMSR